MADLERQLFDAQKSYEAALELLLTIPGLDRVASAKRVVEIGLDMTAFGHAGRLVNGLESALATTNPLASTGPAEPALGWLQEAG